MADLGAIAAQGFLGGPINGFPRYLNVGGYGRNWEMQILKETVEGNPVPTMVFKQPAMFRFRWCVPSGTRKISVQVKQVVNTAPFPTMKVKASSDIGLVADASAVAGAGIGWKTIGPIEVVIASAGATWVELESFNNIGGVIGYCYWDNLIST